VGVDVVIAGGGAVGSSVAYWLRQQPGYQGSVIVCEPDAGYAYAASARSVSSIRRQFSTPLNIALSAFGLQFLQEADRRLAAAAEPVDLQFVAATYLLLATPAGAARLAGNVAIQHAAGVPARCHDAATLARRYPWLRVDDLACGADTEAGEGWFDGYALLAALRRANVRAGLRYVPAAVVDLERHSSGAIRAVQLSSGERIECRYVVNAAGTGSRALAARAGVELPVHARKRNVFVFACPTPIADCPLVVDPGGLWFRPDGARFLCSPPLDADPDVALDDFELQVPLFEERAWPALAHRVPAFEAVRIVSGWVGHYDYNVFDQNAFVGPCPDVAGFLLASGFSGHGLQQAAAIGRGLAEFITSGGYRTIDLSPLGYERYLRNAPLVEHNVI
jgi:FAD-dependent oxidoreductase domain-containing protein 1